MHGKNVAKHNLMAKINSQFVGSLNKVPLSKTPLKVLFTWNFEQATAMYRNLAALICLKSQQQNC